MITKPKPLTPEEKAIADTIRDSLWRQADPRAALSDRELVSRWRGLLFDRNYAFNMKPLPTTVQSFSAPDSDNSRTIAQIRQNLRLAGDPRWQWSDKDIAAFYARPTTFTGTPQQPGSPPVVARKLSDDELMAIVIARARYPGYKSEVVITPEVEQKLRARVETLAEAYRKPFGNQPFTTVVTPNGVKLPMSDDVALSALRHGKRPMSFPVTDFYNLGYSNKEREEYYMRHPRAFNSMIDRYDTPGSGSAFASLVMPLDSFSAFAEVASSSNGGWLGGLLSGITSATNAAAPIYTAVTANKTAKSMLAQQNAANAAQLEFAKAQLAASQNKQPVNWTPIIIGGVALVGIIAFAASRGR